MINGDINEFVNGLYYGDERIFLYKEVKYFIQGYMCNNALTLFLDILDSSSGNDVFSLDDSYEDYRKKIEGCKKTSKEHQYVWTQAIDERHYPVEAFLQVPIFGGKTFSEGRARNRMGGRLKTYAILK